MAEYIVCKDCPSPDCKGCNIRTLTAMLRDGKFDCLMNENRCINPAADVVPVVHGRWEDGAFENSKKCSICGKYATKIHVYNQPAFDYVVCPYCGARMDKEDT